MRTVPARYRSPTIVRSGAQIIQAFYRRAQSDEDTQRRAAELDVDTGTTTARVPVTPESTAAGGSRGHRWLWLLIALVALALIAVQAVAADVSSGDRPGDSIGPRSERDPNPQTSQRLIVSQGHHGAIGT